MQIAAKWRTRVPGQVVNIPAARIKATDEQGSKLMNRGWMPRALQESRARQPRKKASTLLCYPGSSHSSVKLAVHLTYGT